MVRRISLPSTSLAREDTRGARGRLSFRFVQIRTEMSRFERIPEKLCAFCSPFRAEWTCGAAAGSPDRRGGVAPKRAISPASNQTWLATRSTEIGRSDTR